MSLTESSNLQELDLKQLEQQFQQQMPDNLVRIDSGGSPSYWQSSEGAQTAKAAAKEFFEKMTQMDGIDQCTVRMEHQGAASLIMVWAKDKDSKFGGESGFGGTPDSPSAQQNMGQSGSSTMDTSDSPSGKLPSHKAGSGTG